MNRNFKVWDSKNKEWADRDLFSIRGDGVLLRYGGGSHPFTAEKYFIVVDSTGKSDKNGVELFHGDVQEVENYYGDRPAFCIIEWNKNICGFVMKEIGSNSPYICPMWQNLGCVKIGNKFEKPELLEI